MWKLLLLLSWSAVAAIQIEGDLVQPFVYKDVGLREFIDQYAIAMGKQITHGNNVLYGKEKVNVEINKKINKEQFEELFYSILQEQGLTAIIEDEVVWIINMRDIRYTPTAIYESNNIPPTHNFITVVHKLKYPLATDITRNMRPFLSRYGRIINFSNAKTIVINDHGKNAIRLIKLIDTLDTEKAFKGLLAKAEEKRRENLNKTAKLGEEKLELEIKLLEEQLTKLKEGQK